MSGPGRRTRLAALTVLVLGLAVGGTPAAAGAALGAQLVVHADLVSPHPSPREVLRDPLWLLASTVLSSGDRSALMAGLVTDPASSTVAVSIELAQPAVPVTVDVLIGRAARVVNVGGRTVEAYVAPNRLIALAGLAAVRAIRPIRRGSVSDSTNPAVALHGSSAWQAAGLTGSGVKVGIIDGGFDGVAALLGTKLPATIHAHCYTAVGTFTSNIADCANGETHGTAVAESVFDMAPGIDLYVADPISRLDEQRAVAWMTGNGIRVINASFLSGLMFEGPGDGTSPYSDSMYALVDQAVAGGALWVNAAGNAGDAGWTGPWTDADGDGLLDFAPGVSADSMTVAAGADVTVAIRWADPWGASTNNYDLELYSGSTRVASSTDVQAGSGDPFEVIEYQAKTAGQYDIKIRRVSGEATPRMQLMVGTSADVKLAHQVAAGTLPTPADSANPGMLAVGAVRLDRPAEIEPYSSRGPTLDGRVKPDLVAADCAPTMTEDPFCGTSQAAPFVAGAAAQVLQARPGLTPVELAGWLRSHAVPLGSPVPNETFGAGRLDLGPPPFSPPAGLAFAIPPTGAVAGWPLTGQPVVALVDSTGSVVAAGQGSATPISISLALNPAGATLTCAGGLTRTAAAGTALFSGCAIDRPGAGFEIRADASGLPPAMSPPFDILAPGSVLPLSLGTSPATITVGGAASLSARFAPASVGAGRVVGVERSADRLIWSSVGTHSTDGAGRLSVSVTPSANGWYRVRFGGGADLPAATSYPVRVIVRQSIGLAASIHPPATIGRGTVVTFTSTARPAGPGLAPASVEYVVYRRVGTAWVLYRRLVVTVSTTGRARLEWRFATSGSWYVRSWAHATSANGSSALSAITRFDVR